MSEAIQRSIRFTDEQIARMADLKQTGESDAEFVRAILQPFLSGEFEAVRDEKGNVARIKKGGRRQKVADIRPTGNPDYLRRAKARVIRFPDGRQFTMSDLARALGVSRQRVHTIVRECRDKKVDPGADLARRLAEKEAASRKTATARKK